MKSKTYRMIVCSFLILPLYSKATPKILMNYVKSIITLKFIQKTKKSRHIWSLWLGIENLWLFHLATVIYSRSRSLANSIWNHKKDY